MNPGVKNTLEGRSRQTAVQAVFNPRTIILLVILGVFSFGAYFTLAGFAGDLQSGNNGGRHALSKTAIGYGGLLSLLKQNGETVDISRQKILHDKFTTRLRIVSLSPGWFSKDFEEMRLDTPTLIILPKWNTRPLKRHRGWVEKMNTPLPEILSTKMVSSLLSPVSEDVKVSRSPKDSEKIVINAVADSGLDLTESFYAFPKIQTIEGPNLNPILTANGKPLLAQIVGKNIFILADPDFANTQGLNHRDRAEFTYGQLNFLSLSMDTDGYVFDLSMHGFNRTQNLIKLALTPPFLAASLCLLAMGLLAAWQAMARFGAPARQGRKIALGKFALLENAAGFIKLGGRQAKFAADYVDLIRKLTARRLGIPTSLPKDEVVRRLDLYAKHAGLAESWSEIEREKRGPQNATDLMKLAHKLYQWRGEVTHEHR